MLDAMKGQIQDPNTEIQSDDSMAFIPSFIMITRKIMFLFVLSSFHDSASNDISSQLLQTTAQD